MANSGNRLLYILKYLHRMTDEEHYLTAHQIVEYLETVGIHTHRQTVISDIDELYPSNPPPLSKLTLL